MVILASPNWLEISIGFSQIAFFITIGYLTYKTYRKARKNLLNPLNTEYKKLVFERLHKLSNELHHFISEETIKAYDEDFDRYVVNLLNFWRSDSDDKPAFDTDNLIEFQWLKTFIIDLESDPFIPKIMREELYRYYSRLYSQRGRTFRNLINQYLNDLTPRTEGTAEDHLFQIQSQISEKLSDTQFGYLVLRQTTIDFRLSIEDYFDQFETLTKKHIK